MNSIARHLLAVVGVVGAALVAGGFMLMLLIADRIRGTGRG